jgi:hypothetical protein
MVAPGYAFMAAIVAAGATLATSSSAIPPYTCLPFHIVPQTGAITGDGSKIKTVLTVYPVCVISTCWGPIIVFEIDAKSRSVVQRWHLSDQLAICGTPAQRHKRRFTILNLMRWGGSATATRGQVIHIFRGE